MDSVCVFSVLRHKWPAFSECCIVDSAMDQRSRLKSVSRVNVFKFSFLVIIL